MLLFDMDGLLLDTERLYTVATQKILEPYGKEFTYDFKLKLMGRKQGEAAAMLISHYGIQDMTPEEFTERLTSHLEELLPSCALLPGVERLLLHCHKHKIPMAVATSSSGDRFQMKTSNHRELFDKVFDVIVTGDDVENSKPHPEIFQKAARLLAEKRHLKDYLPKNVLVFEDAVIGVEAAQKAEMNIVMVNNMIDFDKVREENTSLGSQTTVFCQTMEDFVPQYWNLPAYED